MLSTAVSMFPCPDIMITGMSDETQLSSEYFDAVHLAILISHKTISYAFELNNSIPGAPQIHFVLFI